jgi:hypothetical protein
MPEHESPRSVQQPPLLLWLVVGFYLFIGVLPMAFVALAIMHRVQDELVIKWVPKVLLFAVPYLGAVYCCYLLIARRARALVISYALTIWVVLSLAVASYSDNVSEEISRPRLRLAVVALHVCASWTVRRLVNNKVLHK